MEDDSCFLHLSPAVTSNNESDVIGVHSPKLCGILKTPNSLSSLNNKSITSLSLNSAKRVTISVERQLDSCRRLRSYSPYGSIWSSNMKSHSRRRRRLNNLSLEALLDQDVLSQWCEDMATPPKCNQNIFSKNINSKESKKNVARVLFDVTNVDSLKADKSDSIIGLNTEFDYPNISSSPTLFQDTTKNKNCSLLDLDSNNSLCMSMEHDKENNWISSPTMVFEKEDKYRTNSSSVLNSLTLESLTHTINEKVEDSDKLKYKLKRKFSLNENLKSDNENCFLSPAVTTKQKISQKISYEMKSRSQSTPIEKKKLFYTSKESQTKESLMNPFYNLNVSKPDIMLSQDFALTCFNQNDENYIKKHEKHKRKSYLNLTNEIFSYSSNDRLLNNSINDEKQFLSPPMIGGFKSNSQFLLSGIWNCSDFYETLTNNVDLITDFNESSPILHAKISASQSVYINRTQSFKNENVTPSSQELVKREKYPCSVTIHKNNLAYSLDSSIKSICTDNYHFVPPVIQSCTVVNQTIVQPCLNQTTLLNNLVQNNNNNISMQSGNSILVNNENLRTKKFSYPKHENRFQNTPQKENIDNKKMQKSGLRKSINYSKNTILPDGFINMDNLTQISADDINSQKFNGDTMSNSLDQNCPAKFSENINQDAKKQQVINKIEVNLLRGFQPGFETKVKGSDKSLQEAEKLFQEESNNIVEDTLMKDFNGFQTGLGKKVEISKKSLQEAKKLFQEEGDNIVEDTLMKDFNGFQTGLGKKVEISKKSLQEAKKLFPEENNNIVEDALMKDFNGFQTGLGKKVEISKKSLQEAKKLFQEESNNIVEDTLMKDFNGFQTGLGKKVEISKKSLQEAKKLFQEESNNIVEDALMKDFNGFQTGLDKKVEISKKSLQEAKKLFPEENNKLLKNKPKVSMFESFQTDLIANQEVDVFKKSTQSANELLQEHSSNDVENSPVNSHQVEKLAFLKKHSSLGKNCSINQSFSSKTDKKKTSSKRNDSIMINNLNCDNVAYQHSVAIASGNSTPSLSSTSCNKFSKDHELLTKNNIKHVSKLRKRKIVFSSCDAYEYDRDAKFILPLPAVITSPDDVFDNCNTTSFDETLKPLKSTFTTPFKMNTTPAQNISSFKKESERKSFCPFQKKRKEGFQTVEIDPIYQKQIGKLYQSKKNCKLLGVFVNYCLLRLPRKFLREELHSFGIKDQLINLNPSNALMFQFYAGYYFSESVLQSKQAIVGDGVKLHFNEEMMITVNEFKQALLNCSSVDKNLINSTWIENHYKWIVWKLASYERMYPEQNAGLCLTPSNVMYQLKYRYDKEVEFSERSCLKCICERDDVSSRRIILCVSSCGPDDQTSEDGKFIWVTDGWYEIKASLDYQLSKFVEQGKIDVGTKLCIYGAELIGSEKACPPLEISQSTMLKLSANSTRRARWHAKLGYQREKVAFPVSLKSLYTDGGLVGCVKVLILRKYPMQWMEKVGGRCLFRNFLAEEQVKKKYEEERSIKMEQLYVKLKKELEMKKDKNVKKKKNYNIKLLNCGKDIFEAIDGATDPAALEQLLSDSQKNLVIKYKQNLTDQFQSELKKRFEEEWKNSEFQERSTVQLQRFRVQCMCNTNQNTILSVWKPTNDINELWNEGVKLSIYNLSCTKNRYKHIKSQVQLSTTHTSKYFVHENEANLNFHSRKAYSIADLCRMNKIPYNEVDIVGFAVKIEPENCMLGVDQTVYLCDDRSKQFLIVKFHGGLKAYSVENIVKESHLVSFSSLTWDHNDKCYPAKNIFCIYSDLSNVSNVNPPYMSKAVKRCKNFIELHPSFLCELRAYLDNHLKTANSTNFTPGNLTPKSNFQNKNITMDVTTPVLPTEKLSYRHRLQMKKRLSLECYREPKPLSVLQANDRNVLTAEFKPPSVKTKTPVQGHPEFSSKTC